MKFSFFANLLILISRRMARLNLTITTFSETYPVVIFICDIKLYRLSAIVYLDFDLISSICAL